MILAVESARYCDMFDTVRKCAADKRTIKLQQWETKETTLIRTVHQTDGRTDGVRHKGPVVFRGHCRPSAHSAASQQQHPKYTHFVDVCVLESERGGQNKKGERGDDSMRLCLTVCVCMCVCIVRDVKDCYCVRGETPPPSPERSSSSSSSSFKETAGFTLT